MTYKCDGNKFTSNVVAICDESNTTWAFSAIVRCEVCTKKVGPDNMTSFVFQLLPFQLRQKTLNHSSDNICYRNSSHDQLWWFVLYCILPG